MYCRGFHPVVRGPLAVPWESADFFASRFVIYLERDYIYSVVQKRRASTHFCFYLWNALTNSYNFRHT